MGLILEDCKKLAHRRGNPGSVLKPYRKLTDLVRLAISAVSYSIARTTNEQRDPMTQPTQRFDKVSIAPHWMIGFGIIAVSALEQIRQQLSQGPLRAGLWKGLHMPAGTVIFGLVLISIIWRQFRSSPPALPTQMRSWERLAATVTKFALYAAMISIPLLGIVFSFGRDKPIDFGLFQFAYPMKHLIADATMKQLRAVHEFLG
jgi:superoxide oxidase